LSRVDGETQPVYGNQAVSTAPLYLYTQENCDISATIPDSQIQWPVDVCFEAMSAVNEEVAFYQIYTCNSTNVLRSIYSPADPGCSTPLTTEQLPDWLTCTNSPITANGISYKSYKWTCNAASSLHPSLVAIAALTFAAFVFVAAWI